MNARDRIFESIVTLLSDAEARAIKVSDPLLRAIFDGLVARYEEERALERANQKGRKAEMSSPSDRGRVERAGLELIGLLAEWEKRDKHSFGPAEADLLLILRKIVSLYDYSQEIEGARVRLEHIRQACYYYDQSWGELKELRTELEEEEK